MALTLLDGISMRFTVLNRTFTFFVKNIKTRDSYENLFTFEEKHICMTVTLYSRQHMHSQCISQQSNAQRLNISYVKTFS